MAKKRPSAAGGAEELDSKWRPRYWRGRIFKSRYSYKGRRARTRNWSVKIQRRGVRKTFALHSSHPARAAAEACRIYRRLVEVGWGGLEKPSGGESPLEPAYWEPRLIRREYSMREAAGGPRELSARIDHGELGHYFPLGTSAIPAAAKRAAEIYRTIATRGWKVANRRFARELTVALRWIERPLVWSYTTIHTRAEPRAPDEPAPGLAGAAVRVAVVEPEPAVRRALAWCVGGLEGFHCGLAGAEPEALAGRLPGSGVRLVLVNRSLASRPGVSWPELLERRTPGVAWVPYSVFEDSDELFRTTPGGIGIYHLHRTPAARLLEPIAALAGARVSAPDVAGAAWRYFKGAFSWPPAVASPFPAATHLTRREHEVLTLLARGHAYKDIADRLRLSIHTVHEHVRNSFEKLGVHNRTEAAVKFLQK